MNSLTAQIDRKRRTALFFGPGTFQAKDTIKGLGKARWQGDKKSWLVSDFSLSDQQLRAVLPDVSIEELSAEEPEQPQSQAIVATKVSSPPKLESILPPESYSVSELVNLTRGVLQQAFPGVIHVYGVLQQVKRYRERVYLKLATETQAKESISCVIWGGEAELCKGLSEKGFELEAELQVMFAVKLDLNPARAELSLSVVGIVAEYTIGKLAALREKTNQRLKDEGIFAANRERDLAFLPQRLGILTSSGGTVINDFMASLKESEFGFDLFWLPVSVQGSKAKKEIPRALRKLEKNYDLDAVLIFRGGGSAADLMVFNEYEIAKAVCQCKIPVFSAIGHQEDQTSLQDVSYQACGVPKDLGRFFSDRVRDLKDSFISSSEEIQSLATAALSQNGQDLEALSEDIVVKGESLIQDKRERCRAFIQFIPSLGKGVLERSLISLAAKSAPISSFAEQSLESTRRVFSDRAVSLVDSIQQKCQMKQQGLSFLTKGLKSRVPEPLERAKLSLLGMEQLFNEFKPETQLRRGFVLLKRLGEEQYLGCGEDLKKDDQVEARFYDTNRKLRVLE